MRRSTILLLPMFLAAAACGSTAATEDTTGAGGGAVATTTGGNNTTGGGTTTGGFTGESFTVEYTPIKVKPGEEDTRCVIKRVGNDGAIHVGQIHNVLQTASHHLIVYRTNDAEEKPEPFPCQPFADLLTPEKGTPLMITQKHDDTLTLPEGVAFTLQPGQMVRLEMHYLNASAEEVEAKASVTFNVLPEADFKDEADFVFMGNPDINVPPQGEQTLGPTFIKLPDDLAGSQFFGVTGHTHQYGTNVTVGTSAAKGEAVTSVYDVPNWSWSEPATVYHDPPFAVPQGGGFNFSCSWKNPTANTLGFGESATKEMCFFWAYYYPSKGMRLCAHTDQFNQANGGVDICCPGNPVCAKIFDYL